MITPLQPLAPMQRLGWLPHFTKLKCRLAIEGCFRRGATYPMLTSIVKVESKERRTTRSGGTEPITIAGRDLLVQLRDDKGHWHRFISRPPFTHEILHDHAALVEHFDIPEIPDLAALQPKRFAEFKKRLKELEPCARSSANLKPATTNAKQDRSARTKPSRN